MKINNMKYYEISINNHVLPLYINKHINIPNKIKANYFFFILVKKKIYIYIYIVML